MNSRNTHLSECTIKGLICDQFPDWKSLTPEQITLSRLAGLTNITYKAEAILDTTPPKQIVFREYDLTFKNLGLEILKALSIPNRSVLFSAQYLTSNLVQDN